VFSSDGIHSVAEMKASADAAGLDFAFITDHGTVAQKRECAKFPNLWWGQEPDTRKRGLHHFVVLGLSRKYVPVHVRGHQERMGTEEDLRRDFDYLRLQDAFVFAAHPTGAFPRMWYKNRTNRQDGRQALLEMSARFGMEVLSSNRPAPLFDEWCASYAELWDELLGNGQEVTGVGCTDAHSAAWLGNTWTGVLGAECTMESIIQSLQEGHCFASQGPAAVLRSGSALMGDVVPVRRGAKVTVSYECADSAGLAWVRVIAGGKVVRQVLDYGKQVIRGRETVAVRGSSGYVRVECAAIDDRRALSNPIYLRPK
jgi:hypothetical protein